MVDGTQGLDDEARRPEFLGRVLGDLFGPGPTMVTKPDDCGRSVNLFCFGQYEYYGFLADARPEPTSADIKQGMN